MSWTCKRESMYMLVYKRVENDHGESLAWYCFTAGIIFNSSLFEYFSIQQITLIYNYLLFHFRMFTISKLQFKMK